MDQEEQPERKRPLSSLLLYALCTFLFYRFVLLDSQGQIRYDVPVYVLLLAWLESKRNGIANKEAIK